MRVYTVATSTAERRLETVACAPVPNPSEVSSRRTRLPLQVVVAFDGGDVAERCRGQEQGEDQADPSVAQVPALREREHRHRGGHRNGNQRERDRDRHERRVAHAEYRSVRICLTRLPTTETVAWATIGQLKSCSLRVGLFTCDQRRLTRHGALVAGLGPVGISQLGRLIAG